MSTEPTIVIAVDVVEGAERATTAARNLFGDGATYVFAHVAEPIPMNPPGSTSMMPTSPVGLGTAPVPDADGDPADIAESRESAERIATEAAAASGFAHTQSVGLLGDPADQLVSEASHRGADAIVLVAHDRGWLSKLLMPSVVDDVRRMSPIPVVVVPSPD